MIYPECTFRKSEVHKVRHMGADLHLGRSDFFSRLETGVARWLSSLTQSHHWIGYLGDFPYS